MPEPKPLTALCADTILNQRLPLDPQIIPADALAHIPFAQLFLSFG